MEIDKDRIISPKNRVFNQNLAIGKNAKNKMCTTYSSVYRITGIEQIKDIMMCGYVRPKKYGISGGHKNEIFWTRGGEKLFYFGESGVILEALEKDVKDGQIGAIPFETLIGIWIFNEKQDKYINYINYFRSLYKEIHSSPEIKGIPITFNNVTTDEEQDNKSKKR